MHDLMERHFFVRLELSWRLCYLLLLVNVLLECGKDLINALSVHDFVVVSIWKSDRSSLDSQ